MKKVTVILSMFVIGFSANAFAQATESMSINFTKMTNHKPKAKPGEAGYTTVTMSDVLVSSAKPNEAPKPTAKPIAQPVKPAKARDFLLDLGDIKGEAPEPKKK